MIPSERELGYLRALERIAETPCGIPGHAVAVGCGASVIARRVLDGRSTQPCRECKGNRWVWGVVGGVYQGATCPSCKGTGYPPEEPSLDRSTQGGET